MLTGSAPQFTIMSTCPSISVVTTMLLNLFELWVQAEVANRMETRVVSSVFFISRKVVGGQSLMNPG